MTMRIRLAVATCWLATLGLTSACGGLVEVGQSPDPSEAPAAWQRLPDPPLDPRTGPVVAWTGSEVVVVGGDTGAPCPPNADCVAPEHYARDGATYAPSARSWHPIAPAPVDVPAFSANVLVSGTLFVLAGTALLAYDVAKDVWSQVSTPSGFVGGQLVADGDRLVVASGSDERSAVPDRVYDTATKRWSALPDDPIGPAYDRLITAIPTGLVLTAKELVDNPGADGPSLVLAARFDRRTGTWSRLPDSDQIGGWSWVWTGRRMVDPSLGGADGGEVGNYGRTVPFGGILDPASGTWSRLPHAPKEGTGGWPVAAFDSALVAIAGWIYDDDTESWAPVPRPHEAPAMPGPAVWADDRLVVIGGVHEDRGFTPDALSPHAWISSSGTTLGKPLQ
jgi:hypothetical protein